MRVAPPMVAQPPAMARRRLVLVGWFPRTRFVPDLYSIDTLSRAHSACALCWDGTHDFDGAGHLRGQYST